MKQIVWITFALIAVYTASYQMPHRSVPTEGVNSDLVALTLLSLKQIDQKMQQRP